MYMYGSPPPVDTPVDADEDAPRGIRGHNLICMNI